MKHFEDILQSIVVEASNSQLQQLIDEASTELLARDRRYGGLDDRSIQEKIQEDGPIIMKIKSDDRHTFASGAMSSGKKPPYHLIPDYALRRIAERFKLGAEFYGEDNWKKGAQDKPFILDRINHAIEHLTILANYVKQGYPFYVDDDAAAVILNAIFVMEWQNQNSPEKDNAVPGR